MSDIDAIRNEAAADEAMAAAAPPGPAPAAGPDPKAALAGELVALMGIALSILTPVLPSLAPIYTEDIKTAAAASIAAVCIKHGWLSAGFLGDYAEEIAAAAVLIPLGKLTYDAVQRDLAFAAAKPAGEGSAAPTPAAEPVADPATA